MSWLSRLFRGAAQGPVRPSQSIRRSSALVLFGPARQVDPISADAVQSHPVVIACIDAVARIAASVRPALTLDGEPVQEHPLLSLVWHPSQQMDYAQMMRVFAAQWLLWGRIAAEKLRTQAGDVAELIPLAAARIKSDSYDAAGHLIAIRYSRDDGSDVDIPARDLLWAIDPSPSDPFAPQQRIASLCDVIKLDNELVRYVADSVAQGMVAKAALVRDKDQRTIQEIQTRLNARTVQRGWQVYDAEEMTVADVGLKPSDIDPAGLLSHTETRICMLFGVPPIVVSARAGLERATYANYREARQHLATDVVQPFLQRVGQVLETQLAGEFGLTPEQVELSWDWSELVGQEDIVERRWQRAAQGWREGVLTRNEARAVLGLPRVSGGDVFRSSLSELPQPGEIEQVSGGA
uniref:Hypothetical conserved protein n=1 Tax=uncultured prokaryote TaxID=198431 RepID=H5SEF4_9ZZZZ|nr:hypothetical conserved protein [uncultured prokaryote]